MPINQMMHILHQRNRKITAIRLLLWMLVFGAAFQSALALGIRPAKTTLVYEETPALAGQFWIVNTEGQELELSLSVEGPLQNYIILRTKEVTLGREEDAAPVYFEVQLPDDFPPGEITSSIVVAQKLSSTDENFIAAKLVLHHKLIAIGPYPDKYVTAKLNFHESGSQIRLVSEVENLGKKDVGSLQTTFYVNDREQNQQVLKTEETSLKTKETKLLDALVARDLFELGEFEVQAVTTYDDHKVEVVKKLLVGRPEVDVAYFSEYFLAHKINPYVLDLLNKWNREIKNVFVDVTIRSEGVTLGQFRTKSIDVEGQRIGRIEDYLDGRERGKGAYAFDLDVSFWNKVRMETKTFQSEFLEEEDADFLITPTVGAAVETGRVARKGEGFSLSTVLLVTLLSLLAGGAGFYVLYRYRHRDEYEGGGGGAL